MRTSENRTNNGSKSKKEYLSRMSIFRSKSKWCSISSQHGKNILELWEKLSKEQMKIKPRICIVLTHGEHCAHLCTTIWYAISCVPSRIQNPPIWSRRLFGLKWFSCKTKNKIFSCLLKRNLEKFISIAFYHVAQKFLYYYCYYDQ